MVCSFEQRSEVRSEVWWPVSLYHPKASKFFNGCSVDVSRGGALVQMPMATPICEGQVVEVNFPRRDNLAQSKGAYARVKSARVVRIDRGSSLESATIKVGLMFNERMGPIPGHNHEM